MKRLLLALALLFATLIGNAAVDSGKSLVEVSEDYKTVTVTINDDPGLENTDCKGPGGDISFNAAFSSWNEMHIIIKGTGLNQKGLSKIGDAMQEWNMNPNKLDLTESKFIGEITILPNRFATLLLAPGFVLPDENVLKNSAKLKYAYSDENEGDKTIHLYVSSQITSIEEIPEFATIEKLGKGWTVYVTGDNAAVVRKELVELGCYVGIVEVDGTGTKESVENLILAQLPEGKDISSIKTLVIKNYTITQDEFDYLATLKDVLNVNLTEAVFSSDVVFDDVSDVVNWETLTLPAGTCLRYDFGNYPKLKYVYSGEKDGDKTIHLYASDKITSIADIPELSGIEGLGAGWMVCLVRDNIAIENELKTKGCSVKSLEGFIEVKGEGNLESLITTELGDKDISYIKTLVVKNHTVTQDEFDYLATLKDVLNVNLTEAVFSSDVVFDDVSDVVNWETLTLPAGTCLRYDFGNYPKLKYVYSGEKDGDKTIHLYASDKITSIADIPELSGIEGLGAGWTVCLVRDNIAIEKELKNKGCSIKKLEGLIEVKGEGNLESLIATELGGKDISYIKTLVVKEHTITQEEFDYLATELKHIVTMDFTDATLPDYVRLGDDIADGSVEWQFLILPTGTKIRPNFAKYGNLKYAVGGGLEKIWIVSTAGGYIAENVNEIAEILPTGINAPKDGIRLSVAFVGPINVDDVAALVSYNAPLSSARIWHLYNSTGLSVDDFGQLETYIQGGNNGEKPTGFVLPPGMNVDEVFSRLSGGNHGNDIGNIYSLSSGEGDNGITLTVRIVNTKTFDIARFATVDTKVAVLTGGVAVDNNIIEALKGTKRCISVDLSEMTFSNNDDAILKGVTEGTVMYVKLPELPKEFQFNIDNYTGTTFGAIARIKTEQTPDTGFKKDIAVCYQRVPGTLNKMVGYRSVEMREHEHIRYRGLFNMHDVEHLMVNNKNIYCDMTDIRIVKYKNEADEGKNPNDFRLDMVEDHPDKNMLLINNGTIKYLALPIGTKIPEDLAAFKQNCPSLLAVGAFDDKDNSLALQSYAPAGGAVAHVAIMFGKPEDTNLTKIRVHKLTMTGNLNFHDITKPCKNYDAQGHYVDGGEADLIPSFFALNSDNLTECDFSNAVFPVQNDMRFSAAAMYSQCTSFKLPTSPLMTIIPDNCMNQFEQVETLCIPANYEIIGENAFRQMSGLTHITTTLTEEDEPDFETDRGKGTIVFSSNLKQIRSTAFWGIHNIYDIYVLAEKAPKCEAGAFDEGMTYGNNGFNNAHPSQRSNYKNGEKTIIGMLHYPRVIVGTEEEKNYTDVTRKYTLIDETGALNGKGELFVWPTHSEFGRSYNQAKCTVTVDGEQRGCNWDAWKERNENGGLYGEYQESILLQLTDDNTYNLEYAGWHEFVLANNYYRNASEGEITPDYSKFKEQDWYTICFPYNMTRSQLLEYFGVPEGETYKVNGNDVTADKDIYPDVRTLVEVKRHRNYSKEGGLITFVFSDNLITEDDGKDVEISAENILTDANGDRYMAAGSKPWKYVAAKRATDKGFEADPIIVKGGYPYIIKPYIPVGKVNDDVHFIPAQSSDELGGGHSIVVNEETGAKVSVPYIDHVVYAIDVDNSNNEKEVYAKDGDGLYHYHFIGTYGFKAIDKDHGVESVALQYKEMPMFSFFISKTKSNPKHLLYRTTTEGNKWNALTSIIGGKSSAQYMNLSRGSNDMTNVYVDFHCDNDAFEDINGNSKKTILAMDFAEDHGGTTGITDYTTVPQENAKSGVYSLDGRFVGTRMDNLPKGIYVANGKKYIVK